MSGTTEWRKAPQQVAGKRLRINSVGEFALQEAGTHCP